MRATAWKAVQRGRLLAAIAGRYGRGRELAVVFGNCQADALRRLTLWLDCNSDFYGTYENIQAQARGELVRPVLE